MKSDPCVFVKRAENGELILLLTVYIDDVLVSGFPLEIERLKSHVKEKVAIKDLGAIKKHLGVVYVLKSDEHGYFYECSMDKYKDEMIDEFKRHINKKELKSFRTPAAGGSNILKQTEEKIDEAGYRKFRGKLQFGARKVWPDICNAEREGCSVLAYPSKEAWKAMEREMGYLQQLTWPLKLRAPLSLQSIGNPDSTWASDAQDRKSVSGSLTTIGGTCLTQWTSRKQKSIATSSTEAEHYGHCDNAKDLIFQHNLITEILGHEAPLPMILYGDNQGANFLATNNQVSQRTKHIDIRYRFLTDLIEQGKLEIRYIKTEENPADIFSKNTKEETHLRHAEAVYNGFIGTPLQEGVEVLHEPRAEKARYNEVSSVSETEGWKPVSAPSKRSSTNPSGGKQRSKTN
jgi:hypothetical protein